MKHRLGIVALGLWALVMVPLSAGAFQFLLGEGTNTLVVADDEQHMSESLLAGPSVDFQGHAMRDLWLLASAGLQFRGTTDGDLRAFARSAVFSGEARQNLSAYAGGIHLTRTAVVGGEAALFANNVICEGHMQGDAWIFARSVTLGGRWEGEVRIQADEIRVSPGTHIGGRLVYTAPRAPVLDPSVHIEGGIEARQAMHPDSSDFLPSLSRTRLLLHGYLYLAALLVGLPFVGFFPLLVGGAVRSLRAAPWRVLLAGLVAVMGGPFLIAFAVMSLVGIPLALVLAALYGVVAYLSHIVVALWLGHLIFRKPGPQHFAGVLTTLAAGLFILYAAAMLPGVTSFLLLPVVVLGAGALITSRLPGRWMAVAPPAPPPFPKAKPPAPPQP